MHASYNGVHRGVERGTLVERVSTRVVEVVVVVRELFSLVTSANCVRIRGDRSEVTKLFTTWLKFFVRFCCVLTVVGS